MHILTGYGLDDYVAVTDAGTVIHKDKPPTYLTALSPRLHLSAHSIGENDHPIMKHRLYYYDVNEQLFWHYSYKHSPQRSCLELHMPAAFRSLMTSTTRFDVDTYILDVVMRSCVWRFVRGYKSHRYPIIPKSLIKYFDPSQPTTVNLLPSGYEVRQSNTIAFIGYYNLTHKVTIYPKRFTLCEIVSTGFIVYDPITQITYIVDDYEVHRIASGHKHYRVIGFEVYAIVNDRLVELVQTPVEDIDHDIFRPQVVMVKV